MEKLLKVKSHKRTILTRNGSPIYLNFPDLTFYVKTKINSFELYFGVKLADYIFCTNLHHDVMINCGNWKEQITEFNIDNIINSFWQSRFHIFNEFNIIKINYSAPIYSIVEDKLLLVSELSDNDFEKIINDLGCNYDVILGLAVLKNDLNLVQFALEKDAKICVDNNIFTKNVLKNIDFDLFKLIVDNTDLTIIRKYGTMYNAGCVVRTDIIDLLKLKGLHLQFAINGLLDIARRKDELESKKINEIICSIIKENDCFRTSEDAELLLRRIICNDNLFILKYLVENKYLDFDVKKSLMCYNTYCIFLDFIDPLGSMKCIDFLLSVGIIDEDFYDVMLLQVYYSYLVYIPEVFNYYFSNNINKTFLFCDKYLNLFSKVGNLDRAISKLCNNKYNLDDINIREHHRLKILANYYNKNKLSSFLGLNKENL